MPANERVITGAIISIDTQVPGGAPVSIGRAISLQVQEQYRVTPIFGIGTITAAELPVLQYSGALDLSIFTIDTTLAANVAGQFSKDQPAADFVRQLLFTNGVNITVSRQTLVNGALQLVKMLQVFNAVCTSENISFQQNEVSSRSGAFIFAEPIKMLSNG